jgi:hypothetical protein
MKIAILAIAAAAIVAGALPIPSSAQSSGTTNVPASGRGSPRPSGNAAGSNQPASGVDLPQATSGNSLGAVTPEAPGGSPSMSGSSRPGSDLANQTKPVTGTGK